MSLLLDALKKAAEQKAENSSEAETELETSVETVLLDQTSTSNSTESEDYTQQTRVESTQYDETELERDSGDKTIKVADDSDSEAFDEDETQVITDEDVTEFIGDGTPLRREQDETLLLDETRTEVVSKNETLSQGSQFDSAQIENAESDLSQYEETELNRDGDDATENETVLTRTSVDQNENNEFSDFSQLEQADEETSASLFDEDDTLTTADALKLANALTEDTRLDQTPHVEITKSLNLVGIPGEDASEVQIDNIEASHEDTSISVPERHILTEDETSTRAESTSTRTFAPDNYDRTLRKPASDDASKLFAGLKSDTDVVMTPEYAKTMFRSKSSAKRMHNFKIYSGTALSIIVVIIVLGILQIDQDTINIDNSLRHLKRDPMPGLIKNTGGEKFTNIFAAPLGSEVDATTLQLIENAESVTTTEEIVAVELADEVEQSDENEVVKASDAESTAGRETQRNTVAKEETNDDIKINVASKSEVEPVKSTAIQISSKSEITQKDSLLREAYAAYQRGDDLLAMTRYNAVIDLDPGNRNALLARAAINIQNNKVAEAIKDYQTLLLANPKDSLAMASLIAVANYSPEQSETQLKLMIRNEPNSPYLNFALGNVFGAQNRWQEAQKLYFTALENNPGDPNYAYNLAVSLEHIAKPKVAIAYYEQALNNFSRGLATFDRDIVDMRLEMLK